MGQFWKVAIRYNYLIYWCLLWHGLNIAMLLSLICSLYLEKNPNLVNFLDSKLWTYFLALHLHVCIFHCHFVGTRNGRFGKRSLDSLHKLHCLQHLMNGIPTMSSFHLNGKGANAHYDSSHCSSTSTWMEVWHLHLQITPKKFSRREFEIFLLSASKIHNIFKNTKTTTFSKIWRPWSAGLCHRVYNQ